jgi:hypothetical protein
MATKKNTSAPAASAVVAAPPAPAIEPTAGDVAAVVDAAKASDAPESGDEAQARELAGAAEGFEAAGEAAASAPAADGEEQPASVQTPLDAARDEAQLQADAENEIPTERESFPVREFPLSISVHNNSSTSLPELVSGAYLAAGSATPITLHDAEHARAFGESLQHQVESNFIDPKLIVIHPA